jgi:hypothetical protein
VDWKDQVLSKMAMSVTLEAERAMVMDGVRLLM